MKIRLHLVRFMYINLILSCCFWLYDYAAAADVSATNTATESNAIKGVNPSGAGLPLAVSAACNVPEHPSPLENVENNEKVPTKEEPATTTTAATSSQQDVDNGRLKEGTEPIANAETKHAAVIDTSVNINVLPSDVNTNINKEYSSVVPNSEKSNNAGIEATANVPKNQLNNDNNHNIYITSSVDDNQIAKSQQTRLRVDAGNAIPARDGQQQQQQEERQQQHKESLPEIITELPAVTVTDLPVELEHVKERLAPILPHEAVHGASNKSEDQQQPEAQVHEKAELNINDPSGGLKLFPFSSSEANIVADANVTGEGENIATDEGSNDTAEEVPMPVFSEWAQKQIEAEASREQAMELEQQVVNTSAQRRDAAGSGNGKAPPLKLRAKNYASPDCGAKIIGSNADASNTGAVLSHSSDEYMLSTCGSRIWFVVELCEAVQAQKVELANFELFSSSPKNFTVAVSKRFPTRDWSNVGRFTAEDKRTVQTFELHPHLFGKFVRVDIHSHYSKEHFCPISLFRVFGTSEFEAFETEIRHSDELDDFDDDDGQEQQHKPTGGNDGGGGANIFQSASDAVIQMVKKAAQVLVKPTKALRWSSDSSLCYTPAAGLYSCQSCNSSMVERINNLLACQSQQLQLLLLLPQLRSQLLQTRICQQEYNISLSQDADTLGQTSGMDRRQSFYLSVFTAEHVGAMCKLLQVEYGLEKPVDLTGPNLQLEANNLPAANVSIVEAESETKANTPNSGSVPDLMPILEVVSPDASSSAELSATAKTDSQSADSLEKAAHPSDVNIFNVPSDVKKDAPAGTGPTVTDPLPAATSATSAEHNEAETTKAPAVVTTTNHPATSSGESDNGEIMGSGNGMMDDGNLSNWESIDSLLTTTVASITAGGGAAAAAAAVVNGNAGNTAGTHAAGAGGINLQPKLTHGPQSESVFIRLSNRIKALERNMSLSGQYLEELSRRYKKQVEELQQTLTQQTLTVRTLEDQSRRLLEQEQLYQRQSAELAGEVRALTYQVQACIMVIIIVGTCIFLMVVMGTVFYRKLRRQTKELLPVATASTMIIDSSRQQLSRRKSYEEIVQSQTPVKQRRPSEEAMLIMNGCGDSSHVAEQTTAGQEGRRRKISICYGSNNNISNNMLGSTRSSLHRRKGLKNCLHASLDSTAPLSCGENLDKFFDVDTLKGHKQHSGKANKKKAQQHLQQELLLKRQESAPANCTAPGSLAEEETPQSDFDESLILDDDDLCNFIPNSDLAYNEFMPEGPSGYQIVDTVDGKSEKARTTKKSRRVSSPAFFKSPFSKSRNKEVDSHGLRTSHSAHEATSWEWYRLKRNDKHSKLSQGPATASVSANASLDNSSLSEVSFPFNSTQNSFRILGEAIGKNSSGVAATTRGSSSSSGDSTTSSTAKKKQRTFNNIFRKVF